MGKKKKDLSIRGQIRRGNSYIIYIIYFVVVCSLINLLLIDMYQFNENKFQTTINEVSNVLTMQYKWVDDIRSVENGGKGPEMDASACSFGVWYQQNQKAVSKDFPEAFEQAAAYHNGLHEAGAEYLKALGQENENEAANKITEQSEGLYNALHEIVEGYLAKAQHSHDELVSRIIWAIMTCVVLAIAATITAKKLGDKLAKKISSPIAAVADWSEELSKGSADLDFNVSAGMETDLVEIQRMIASFRAMAESIQENVRVVQKVADGDMTAFVNIRSASDSLGKNLYRMVQSNDLMFAEITQIANSVAEGAGNISKASMGLAESCSVQAGAVKDFAEVIDETHNFITENNAKAGNALQVTDEIRKEIQESTAEMQELLTAMGEIREASEKVSAIIKTIDGIAGQTNMLALNAAIEAARAGEAGKGFAVVADEVKDLAAKSSEAAEESKKLIQDTVGKAAVGDEISQKTSETFGKIADSVESIIGINKEMADAGKIQQKHIDAVKENINTISAAIDENAASSEEAAASSDELNENAVNLKEAMNKFNLRKRVPGQPYIPPEKQGDTDFIKEAEKNYRNAVQKGLAKF